MFVDREFIMRSQGQVRFITISARLQIAAVIAMLVVAVVVAGSLATVTAMGLNAQRQNAALAAREAKAASVEDRVALYRKNLDVVADDLVDRQAFIEKIVDAHIGDLPADIADKPGTPGEEGEAAGLLRKIGSLLPEAAPFTAIEARQLTLVARLTEYAEDRADSAAKAIRKLGLNPDVMLASAGEAPARGGPYVGLATAADSALDERFHKLGASLARMEALERSLDRIPQVSPAHLDFVSSSYGYRSDPFTGEAAFHGGLDFPGHAGAPIFAAARGVVSFVGTRAGYGNLIEVTHGKGLMTRYAHLSRFDARVGQKVEPGDVIAAMGSTGRSTGPHLHFEVRINGQAVNPRPFLEAAQHVHKEAGSGS